MGSNREYEEWEDKTQPCGRRKYVAVPSISKETRRYKNHEIIPLIILRCCPRPHHTPHHY